MEFQPLYAHFFHKLTRAEKGIAPADPDTWSKEWANIYLKLYFKSYPRFPRLDLKPYVGPLSSVSIQEALCNRSSHRDFDKRPISISQLSNLLYYSAGIKELDKVIKSNDWQRSSRFYPSGGSLYPLEIYLFILRGDNILTPGVYHYYAKEHVLELLWERDFLKDNNLDGILAYPWAFDASIIIFTTAIFWRQMKYGERGYRYILLTAGHLGQNFALVSEALGIGCCPFTGYADEEIDKIIGIDGVTESSIYAFVIGNKKKGGA